VIGDMAELFGCVMDCPPMITAISFVALGTSMPDLFASKTAAMQDPYADASIVNVTGSNSVNVFLGLGLPWTIGAIYWRVAPWDDEWEYRYPEQARERRESQVMAFIVEADSLVFGVVVFSIAAVVCLLMLGVRRRKIGGELGGPFALKVATTASLVLLWSSYIGLSAWYTLRHNKADEVETLTIYVTIGGLCGISVIIVMFFALREATPERTPSPRSSWHEAEYQVEDVQGETIGTSLTTSMATSLAAGQAQHFSSAEGEHKAYLRSGTGGTLTDVSWTSNEKLSGHDKPCPPIQEVDDSCKSFEKEDFPQRECSESVAGSMLEAERTKSSDTTVEVERRQEDMEATLRPGPYLTSNCEDLHAAIASETTGKVRQSGDTLMLIGSEGEMKSTDIHYQPSCCITCCLSSSYGAVPFNSPRLDNKRGH